MKRIHFKTIYWALFFMLVFRILFRTPFTSILVNVEAVIIGLLFVFYIWRVIMAVVGKIKFSRYEVYLSGLLIFPLWSAIAAYFQWRQPVFYGIATQRGFFLFLSAFYLLYSLKKGNVTPAILKNAFLIVAWGSLICFFIASKVMNPEKYIDTELVEFNKLKGGYVFQFMITFLTFGFLYYSIKLLKSGHLKWLIPVSLFLGYILFVRQDRSISITVIAVFGLYYLQNELKRNFAKSILGALIIMSCILSILLSTGTSFISESLQKYENIFKIASGESTSESSTNARKVETIKVIPYIIKNPVFGNGDLSQQFKNGFARIFGYLYPADIGIIGELFLFGILGTFLLNTQFLLGWYYANKTAIYKKDVFYLACKYSLFTFFMDSLTAGQTVFFSANSVIMITILYFYYQQIQIERSNEKATEITPSEKPSIPFPSSTSGFLLSKKAR